MTIDGALSKHEAARLLMVQGADLVYIGRGSEPLGRFVCMRCIGLNAAWLNWLFLGRPLSSRRK